MYNYIKQYDSGYCTHSECMIFNNFSLKKRKFCCYSWLIHVNNKNYLWDLGYNANFFHKKITHKIYQNITPVTLKNSVKQQINEMFKIENIILSHFHADHISGISDFSEYDYLLHSKLEIFLDYKYNIFSDFKLLKHGVLPYLYKDLNKISFIDEKYKKIKLPDIFYPFEFGWQVEEDFIIVELPGHAIGHIGAFIKTEKWNLIASDAAWSHKSIIENIKPHFLSYLIMANKSDYIDTLNKLNILSKRGMNIILSHDINKGIIC